MWVFLGLAVDLIHALTMVAWFAGLPLLFVTRWPRLRLAYASFALLFIVVSQASMVFLGECIFTTLTRWCLRHDPTQVISNDWFTVRIARAVFGMAPSHHAISRLSEVLIFVTAAGVIASIARARRGAAPGHASPMRDAPVR